MDTMKTEIRKAITRVELNEWLTQELRKVEDCEDAKLVMQYQLVEPDEHGCNWSGLVASPGSKMTTAQISPIAAAIGRRASALFNLVD